MCIRSTTYIVTVSVKVIFPTSQNQMAAWLLKVNLFITRTNIQKDNTKVPVHMHIHTIMWTQMHTGKLFETEK